MVQNVFIGLPLSVFDTIVIFRIWGDVVARSELRKVALDVAGGAGASWSGESDIGGHLQISKDEGGKKTAMLVLMVEQNGAELLYNR